MSEAIDRVREFAAAARAFAERTGRGSHMVGWADNGTDRTTTLMLDDLEAILAGYIPPEHHDAIRCAAAHVAELREAWERGCFTEHDGLYGLRSNRNADVDRKLRAALAAMPKAGA